MQNSNYKIRAMLYRDFLNLKSTMSLNLVDQHFLAGTMTNLWAPGNFDKLKVLMPKIESLLCDSSTNEQCVDALKEIDTYFKFIIKKKATWIDWLAPEIKGFQADIEKTLLDNRAGAKKLLNAIYGFLDVKLRKGCTENLSTIRDPTFSILTRFIKKYPEYLFIPNDPDYSEIYSIVDRAWNCGGWLDIPFDEKNPVYPEHDFSPRRIGILFGCSATTGYSWENGSNISKIVLHLMMIVKSTIDKNGAEGFKKYVEVVHEEARSRGIDIDRELWFDGWKSQLRKDGERVVGNHVRMQIRDMVNLQNRLGLSLIDIQWLIGSLGHVSSVKDRGLIEDPTFAILIRYLTKYPEELLVPKAPDIGDFIKQITPIWSESKWKHLVFNKSRVGVMLGCTKIAGYSWDKETTTPSQSVQHLMMTILKAVSDDGIAGLNKYLSLVEDEAKVRNVGPEQLWIKEGWSTFKRQGY